MNPYRYRMVGDLWRALKLVLWGLLVFVAFAALIECVQAYQVLRGVHPALGWSFLVALLAAVGWGIAYYTVAMARRPVVLVPPPRCDLETAGPRNVRRYARYLARVMEHLAGNPLIPADQTAALREHAGALRGRLGRGQDMAQLAATLEREVDDVIMPAIVPLDEEAARRVRNCVRDTMVGVALSPWRSIDLLVVLYRNGRMVLEVSGIYNGRPGLRDQVRIFADVVRIAATVQFLNIGSKLMENLAAGIPVLGRFADDIAQGIGAGLFTSVAGQATIDRCRAFHGWSEAEARSGMAANLKHFMADLKGIAGDVVLPALKGRIEAETPPDRRTPNLMERLKAGIGDAVDATSETVDSFVMKPVMVGYKGVATTGAILWSGTRRAGSGVGRAAAWTGRHGWRLSTGGLKAVGRGVAHTARSATRLVSRDREEPGNDQ